jgi:hypothetical protein
MTMTVQATIGSERIVLLSGSEELGSYGPDDEDALTAKIAQVGIPTVSHDRTFAPSYWLLEAILTSAICANTPCPHCHTRTAWPDFAPYCSIVCEHAASEKARS